MGVEGAVNIIFRDQLEKADDRASELKRLTTELRGHLREPVCRSQPRVRGRCDHPVGDPAAGHRRLPDAGREARSQPVPQARQYPVVILLYVSLHKDSASLRSPGRPGAGGPRPGGPDDDAPGTSLRPSARRQSRRDRHPHHAWHAGRWASRPWRSTATSDAAARHVRFADQAVRIGPPPANQSYLLADRIVEAARATGCASGASGLRLPVRAGSVRTGRGGGRHRLRRTHPAHALVAGRQARGTPLRHRTERAHRAGHVRAAARREDPSSMDAIAATAERIGYPCAVKAAAGGGGRGMRRVDDPGDLPMAVATAAREAKQAFGDGSVYLEHYVEGGRHIEFQLLGDVQGTIIALGEARLLHAATPPEAGGGGAGTWSHTRAADPRPSARRPGRHGLSGCGTRRPPNSCSVARATSISSRSTPGSRWSTA